MPASWASIATSGCDLCRPNRVYVKHIEGKGIGYQEGYSSLGVFLAPFKINHWLIPFFDGRAHLFNSGKFAANLGGGLRRTFHGCSVIGINGYYDYRHRPHGDFHQVGIGGEYLSSRLEGRLNGYFPVGRRRSVGNPATFFGFGGFSGHQLLIQRALISNRFDYSMTGVDGEIGLHLIKPHRRWVIYAGAGPYYFRDRQGKSTTGAAARVWVRATPYFSFEVRDSYDHRFQNNFQVELAAYLPLGRRANKQPGCNLSLCPSTLEHLLTSIPHRQEIIAVDKHRDPNPPVTFFAAIDPNSGQPYTFDFVRNQDPPGADGTFEHPYDLLQSVQANSSPGDIIYVFCGDGTTTGMDQGIILQDRQSLLGAGQAYTFATQVGPITVPPLSAGLPSITNMNGVVVTVANDNQISGFIIRQESSDNCISGSLIANPTISNNIVNVTGSGSGIFLSDITGTITLSNNTLNGNNSGAFGLRLDETESNQCTLVATNNSTMNWIAIAGFYVTASDAAVVTAQLDRNFSSNPTASGLNGSGMRLDASDSAVLKAIIINNQFLANHNSGVAFALNDNSQFFGSIVSNTISNTGGNGIQLDLNNEAQAALTCLQNTSTFNGARGIDFNYGSPTISLEARIAGNFITQNGLEGIGGENPFQGTLKLAVVNNGFANNGGSGDVAITFTGTTASSQLNFNSTSNTTTPAYHISNSGSGTYLLEVPRGNSGQILLNGIIVVPLATGGL
jgi:hypothetical protein